MLKWNRVSEVETTEKTKLLNPFCPSYASSHLICIGTEKENVARGVERGALQKREWVNSRFWSILFVMCDFNFVKSWITLQTTLFWRERKKGWSFSHYDRFTAVDWLQLNLRDLGIFYLPFIWGLSFIANVLRDKNSRFKTR